MPLNLKLDPALLLVLFSGAAALAHQILWTRRMVDALGANADTFSKVIGSFFVGLALGAWFASRKGNPPQGTPAELRRPNANDEHHE